MQIDTETPLELESVDTVGIGSVRRDMDKILSEIESQVLKDDYVIDASSLAEPLNNVKNFLCDSDLCQKIRECDYVIQSLVSKYNTALTTLNNLEKKNTSENSQGESETNDSKEPLSDNENSATNENNSHIMAQYEELHKLYTQSLLKNEELNFKLEQSAFSEEKYKETQNKLLQLEDDHKFLLEKYDNLVKENSELKTEIADLNNQKNSMIKELNYSNKKTEYFSLLNRNSKCDLDNAMKKINAFGSEITEKNMVIGNLEKENDDLKTKISKLVKSEKKEIILENPVSYQKSEASLSSKSEFKLGNMISNPESWKTESKKSKIVVSEKKIKPFTSYLKEDSEYVISNEIEFTLNLSCAKEFDFGCDSKSRIKVKKIYNIDKVIINQPKVTEIGSDGGCKII